MICDDVIERIVASSLNYETLARVHYIADDVKDVVGALIDKAYADIEDNDAISILQTLVAESESL